MGPKIAPQQALASTDRVRWLSGAGFHIGALVCLGLLLIHPLHAQTPFQCEPKLYQSASPGPRLYVYDPTTNSYDTISTSNGERMNGMGYNTADDFIYGCASSNLVQLDAQGVYRTLGAGAVLGFCNNSGDFWGANRLLNGPGGGGSSSNSWKSIDVTNPSSPVVTNFNLTGPKFGAGGADDFTVLGNTAYGWGPGSSTSTAPILSVVNLITQEVVHKTTTGVAVSGRTGAAYADALGNLYFHVNGGSVYQIKAEELSKPNPAHVSMGLPPKAGGSTLSPANDGASCPNAGSAFSAEITNEAVTGLAATTASLHADVNPNGIETTARVCLGPSAVTSGGLLQGCTFTAQAANASDGSPLTGNTAVSLTPIDLTGLTPRTTYYWQVVTNSAATTTYGSVSSFTTTGPPIATTQAASSVTTTTATLNGLINPGNRSTDVVFCVGTATDLAGCNSYNASPFTLTGGNDQAVSLNLTALDEGTTYYARVEATNADGSDTGAIIEFTTSALPEVTLNAATDITSTDARLQASVNPKGEQTDVSFCYGTQANLSGCTTKTASGSPLPAVDAASLVSVSLSGLTPATTYYIQVEATNGNGTQTSAIGSFTTEPRPLVLTTTTGALPDGVVDSAYATTLSADGGVEPYSWAIGGGSLPLGVSLDGTSGALTGTPSIDGGSSFLIEVTDATNQTASKTFTIQTIDAPIAITEAVSSIGTTTATLNGVVDPGNALTIAEFCLGTAADLSGCDTWVSDQSPLAASTSPAAIDVEVSGLTPATTYYVRAQASNAPGQSLGEVVEFRTVSAPDATTVSATFRDKQGDALLNALINPNGLETTVSYCLGTTPTLSPCNPIQATASPLPADHGAVVLSTEVTSLGVGQTYYFNVTAVNSAGTDVGETIEFTMPTANALEPEITQINPNEGDEAGGTTITITGNNFSTTNVGATVAIGATMATVSNVTSTQITAITPPGTPGPVDVIVFNVDGQAVREVNGFTYTSAQTYGVTYASNGATEGSGPTDVSAYAYGDTIALPGRATWARTGYVFSGWSSSASGAGTNYAVGDELTITQDVTMHARWIPVALPALDRTTLAFGSKAVGDSTTAKQTVFLLNSGAGNLTIDAAGLTIAGAAATDFSVAGGTCSAGGTVAPFASCTLEIAFDPTVVGVRTGTMNVATSEGSLSVSLSGSGLSTPQAPTQLVVTPGNGQLSIAFDAPDDGGSSITDYQYQLDGGSWASATVTTSPVVITGLTNGTEYSVRLRAKNAVGEGVSSSSVSGTPVTIPAAPTNLVITAGNGQLSIAFDAPDNGGSSITDYEYQLDGGSWISAGVIASPVVITGLSNGTEYSVRLRAKNAVGEGDPSSSVSGTPVTVPAAPTNLVITAGNGQLSIAFDAPDDGGAAITDYQYQLDGGSWASANVTTSPVVITGLTNGTEYSVRLRAKNAVGEGVSSSSVSGTPVTVPAAPTNLVITAGNGQLSIAFDAPDDGGSSIMDYEYTLDGGSWISAGVIASPVVITGLSNGTEYGVRLRAKNAVGEGDPSSSVLATPTRTPHQLALYLDKTTLVAGAQMPVVVEVQDDQGERVISEGSRSVTLAQQGSQGQVDGWGDVTLEAGQTTVLIRGDRTGVVTLTATASGLVGAEDSLTVVAGPAATLAFAQSPQLGESGGGLSTQPKVEITDQRGNRVNNQTIQVLALLDKPSTSSAELTGTTQIFTSNGLAVFTDLEIQEATEGPYQLMFRTDGVEDLRSVALQPQIEPAPEPTPEITSAPPPVPVPVAERWVLVLLALMCLFMIRHHGHFRHSDSS